MSSYGHVRRYQSKSGLLVALCRFLVSLSVASSVVWMALTQTVVSDFSANRPCRQLFRRRDIVFHSPTCAFYIYSSLAPQEWYLLLLFQVLWYHPMIAFRSTCHRQSPHFTFIRWAFFLPSLLKNGIWPASICLSNFELAWTQPTIGYLVVDFRLLAIVRLICTQIR